MISRQPKYGKSRVFARKGIVIHFPRENNQGKELFVGEKPFVPRNEVVDEVLNFFVYYLDDQGVVTPQTDFSDFPLVIQVGYDHSPHKRTLYIYPMPAGKPEEYSQALGNADDLPGNFYGFQGSYRVELDQIAPDPCVGWGG